jgi:hypothetical protein
MCMHNPSLYMWGCPKCTGVPPFNPWAPPPPAVMEHIRRHAQHDAQEALALDAQIAGLEDERRSLEEQVAVLQDHIYLVNRNLAALVEDRKKYPPKA